MKILKRELNNNGDNDYVKPRFLDQLIESNQVITFYRHSGLAVLGVDRVRSSQNRDYDGPECRVSA